MASLTVTVAAYGSFDAAEADWTDVDRDPNGESVVIDAALIERSENRVVKVHHCSSTGWARGAVAGAVLGRLSPSALLDGAFAGGVGKQALSCVSSGLSRDAVNELGRVLESGRFVTLAVAERDPMPTTTLYGARSLSVAHLPLRGTALDLRRAVLTDEADE